jgi:hypothetical protein
VASNGISIIMRSVNRPKLPAGVVQVIIYVTP